MIIQNPCKKMLLAAVLIAAAAVPALAQISISINVAPPQPQYEVVPVLAPAQVWAPGYWAWNGDRHVWVRGRIIANREGYRWMPDRWEQKDGGYYRQSGYWVQDITYVYEKDKKYKKSKYEKYEEKHEKYHDKEEKHEDKHHGKGHKHKD